MIVCVCQTIIGSMTTSSNFACCWKLDQREGIRSKLHIVLNGLKVHYIPMLNML